MVGNAPKPIPTTQVAEQRKRLSEALAEAQQNVAHRSVTQTAPVAAVQEDKFAKISENPFYQIAIANALPNQKRDEMAKLLTYDKSKSAEENEKQLKQYVQFLEWMQEQRLLGAKSNVRGQNAKVMAELKQVIDDFSKGMVDIKTHLAPFIRRLESVYNVRLSGKAVGLLEEIVADRQAIEENKKLLEQQTGALNTKSGELESVSRGIEDTTRQIAELGEDHRFGLSFLGLKSDARKAKAQKEIDLQLAQQRVTALEADVERQKTAVEETRQKIGMPRETQFGELASEKQELIEMLNISSEEHVNAHEQLKAKVLGFIDTSETRIDAVLANVQQNDDLTRKTARGNGRMVILSAAMNEAVKVAMENNQRTLAEFQPPAEAEDEISKAVREENRTALEVHIKSMTVADGHTSEMRNALVREKDQLNALLQANDERIRATKHLRTSGVANMSVEMAVTMAALGDAANSEAVQMAQTMVDAAGKNAQDIRAKEVLRHAMEMGVRNEQLAAQILATQQATAVAKVGMDEQYKAVREATKLTEGLDSESAALQEVLAKTEGVYAQAQRDGLADAAAAEASGAGVQSVIVPAPANSDTRKPVAAPAPNGPDSPFFN